MNQTLLCMAMVGAMMFAILPFAPADDHYAAQNGQAPGGTYTAWGIAASNIQDAVNAATTNDTVWVGAGRYTVPPNAVVWMGTNVVYIDKPMTLRSSNGVPATAIIDGSGVNRGIAAYYLTSTSNRYVIDGVTVSNCFATNAGGGILFDSGNSWSVYWTGVVQNCFIANNTVSNGSGGGIATPRAYAVTIISNCVIRGNTAMGTGYGGGVYITYSYGNNLITRCIIESNSAYNAGGVNSGNAGSKSMTEYCVIRGNKAIFGPGPWAAGGGWLLSGGTHTMRNCLIYDNVSESGGGGIVVYYGIGEIYNCTIVSNRATTRGSGIEFRFGDQGARMRIWNSTIYSNYSDMYIQAQYDYTNAWFTNCCLTSTNWANDPSKALQGAGNITNNPKFADCAGHNFRLSATSPCINAGLYQTWMEGSPDLDNHSRIDRFSGKVDIGCYEYLPKGILFKAR